MIRNFEYLIVFTSAPGVLPEQNWSILNLTLKSEWNKKYKKEVEIYKNTWEADPKNRENLVGIINCNRSLWKIF